MVLKICAIERSRRVDSEAWCFFLSSQKIRDARAPQSRAFREKMPLWNTKIYEILHFLFIDNTSTTAGCTVFARSKRYPRCIVKQAKID